MGQVLSRDIHRQELRQDVAMTLATMMASDILLNPKYVQDMKGAVTRMWRFVGSALGVTKADLGKISQKLVSQLGNYDTDEAAEKQKKRPKSSGAGLPGEFNVSGDESCHVMSVFVLYKL